MDGIFLLGGNFNDIKAISNCVLISLIALAKVGRKLGQITHRGQVVVVVPFVILYLNRIIV